MTTSVTVLMICRLYLKCDNSEESGNHGLVNIAVAPNSGKIIIIISSIIIVSCSFVNPSLCIIEVGYRSYTSEIDKVRNDSLTICSRRGTVVLKIIHTLVDIRYTVFCGEMIMLCLYSISICTHKLTTYFLWSLVHSCLTNGSNWVKLAGFLDITRAFKSPRKLSMRFRSGL